MSSGEGKFGREHLLGGTSLPRNILPQIRGFIRRGDPDANPEPHWTGLTGTSLDLDLSPIGVINVAFVSDNLDDAIAAVNAASPANLVGIDEDGYLVLKNINGGAKNYIQINAPSTAAAILGFRVAPEPGFKSFAGELATSSAGRTSGQVNPAGTALLASDEDLSSSSINRAIFGLNQYVKKLAQELDVRTLTTRQITNLSAVVHAGSGKTVIYIKSPIMFPLVRPAGVGFEGVVVIQTSSGGPVIDINESPRRLSVLNIYSEEVGTGSPALDGGSPPVWQTPGGKSLENAATDDNKVDPISITEIKGDVVTLGSALPSPIEDTIFTGDTAVIEAATNDVPFNHNGEYILVEVLDTTHVRVRPKTQFDPTYAVSDKPQALNADLPGGTSYGTLRVILGEYWHCESGIALELDSWAPALVSVRIAHAVRMSELEQSAELVAGHQGISTENEDNLLAQFGEHILSAPVGFRHAAADVDGSAAAGVPDSLASGTVQNQLEQLLNHVNNLIAGQVTYAGGINWADTAGDTPSGPTANPSISLEGQVDKILTDLAGVGVDGVAKLRALAAGDLNAGNLRTVLNQLSVEWLKLDRNNAVSGSNTFMNTQVINGPANELLPALETTVKASGAAEFKLIWAMPISFTTDMKARMYIGGTDVFCIVINAVWDGNAWDREELGECGLKMSWSDEGIRIEGDKVGFTSWVDADWAPFSFFDTNGREVFFSQLIKTIGKDRLGTALDAGEPRISIPIADASISASTKTCLFKFDQAPFTTDGIWRLYVGETASQGNGAFDLVFNAKWQGNLQQWSKDNGAIRSTLYRWTVENIIVGTREGVGNFDDTFQETAGGGGWHHRMNFDVTLGLLDLLESELVTDLIETLVVRAGSGYFGGAPDHGGKQVSYGGAHAAWNKEYISSRFGIMAREGRRVVTDFDWSGFGLQAPWALNVTGFGNGSSSISPTSSIRIDHDGTGGDGSHHLYADGGTKVDLSKGFVLRFRANFNNSFTALNTVRKVGFFDAGTGAEGLTLGYRSSIGFGLFTQAGLHILDNDATTDAMLWYTLAVLPGDNTVYWTIETAVPDPSFILNTLNNTLIGSTVVTIPAGTWDYGVQVDGDSAPAVSSLTIDYFELITGGR